MGNVDLRACFRSMTLISRWERPRPMSRAMGGFMRICRRPPSASRSGFCRSQQRPRRIVRSAVFGTGQDGRTNQRALQQSEVTTTKAQLRRQLDLAVLNNARFAILDMRARRRSRSPGPPSIISPSRRKATPASSSADRIATSMSPAGTRLLFSKSRTVPSLTCALAPKLACDQSSKTRAARHCSTHNWVTNGSSIGSARVRAKRACASERSS